MQLRKLSRRVAATGLAVAVAASLGMTGSATAAPAQGNPTGAVDKLGGLGSGDGASAQATVPTPIGDVLGSGQSLSEAQALQSKSGQHVLTTNGYAGEQYGIVLTGWTGDPYVLSSIPDATANVTNTLAMQADGNLVLYSNYNNGTPTRVTWASNTNGNPGAVVALQDDRNLVVYSSTGRALWGSARTLETMTSYYLDNVNKEDGTLNPSWYLLSQNRRYMLVLQADGNLVLYGLGPNRVLWATNTSGNPGSVLAMQTDGNLVLYSSAGKVLWATGANSNPVGANVMSLQNDGNLVKYYFTDRVSAIRWATNTAGR